MKKEKAVAAAVFAALLVLAAACIGYFALPGLRQVGQDGQQAETEQTETAQVETEQSDSEQEASAATETDSDSWLHITWQGREYSYNSRIITVMYAGVDSDEELITYNRYSIAPRADTIILVVFDDYNKAISMIGISRDAITSVARYTMNGSYRDNYDTHLGYAYTYGDGGQASCNNLIESVRNLMHGVPVHEYVITNNSSVGRLNDMVGGVTVTVPNDDLADRYPEFQPGAVVTLDAEAADVFARWRDTSIAFTNDGRMERQKEFSSAFFRKFADMVSSDTDGTWEQIEAFIASCQTSITRNQYLDLADRLETETFSEDSCFILEGQDIYDEENDVDMYYVDEDSLMETIVKVFYLEDAS